MEHFNIAIDGPAGAGKSTLAKKLAQELSCVYVDTGAMYRALGVYFSRLGLDLADEAAVSEAVSGATVSLSYQDGVQQVFLNGEDVSAVIRSEEAGLAASRTSAYPAVRAQLTQLQKDLAAKENVVMDGRDIGSVVLPDAQLKIYLTASFRVRGSRRFEELKAKGENPDLSRIIADIEQRDEQDKTRKVAPLIQAEDAELLDSSDLDINGVLERMRELCRSHGLL